MQPVWNPNSTYFGSIAFASLLVPKLTFPRCIDTRCLCTWYLYCRCRGNHEQLLSCSSHPSGWTRCGRTLQATNWSDEGNLQQIFDRVVQSGKWQCSVMIHGFVMTPAAHCVLESGGGQEAQQACMIHVAVHYKRDKKWLMHSDLTTVTSFMIAVQKQLQPLRDHLGRPMFQLGPTHATSIKQHLR